LNGYFSFSRNAFASRKPDRWFAAGAGYPSLRERILATMMTATAVRVHPEFLEKQKLPPELVTKDIWKDRLKDIRRFEQYLTRNGVIIRKFFLHVSKKEQKRRFLERLQNPEKNWKFSANDIKEREFWDEYMTVYEDTIRRTATKDAPWYVVPADNKWFTRVVVAAAIVETLGSLDLKYPQVSKEKLKELAAAKRTLLGGR